MALIKTQSENQQRAITQKIRKVELWFLYTEFPHVFYQCITDGQSDSCVPSTHTHTQTLLLGIKIRKDTKNKNQNCPFNISFQSFMDS